MIVSCRERLKAFFLNRINFCHGYYYPSEEPKPQNLVYDFFYRNWLRPWKQNDCLCCNAVRGLIYGLIIGIFMGRYVL